MKFGICYCYWSKDWEGNDYPKMIERARACGFDALEIFWGRTLTMEQQEVNEILAASRANDVEIYVSGGFGKEEDLSQADETGRRAAVEILFCAAISFTRAAAIKRSLLYSSDFDISPRSVESV